LTGQLENKKSQNINNKTELYSFAVQFLFSLYIFFLFFFGHHSDWNPFFFLALPFAFLLENNDPSEGKARHFRNLFISLLLSFALINILSAFFAVDAEGMEFSNRSNDHYYGVAIALGLGLGLRSLISVRRMLVILLVLGGIWYSWEFLNLFIGEPFMDGRFEGFWGYHWNTTAMMLLVLFSLNFSYSFAAQRKMSSLFSSVAAFLTGTLLFWTKSRFALLTLLIITIPCGLFLQRRVGSIRAKFVVAALVVCLITPMAGLLWFHKASPERKSLKNAKYRLTVWADTLKIIKESSDMRVVTGQGTILHNHLKLKKHFHVGSEVGSESPHAHNAILQVLLETGVLGVINFVLIWLVSFWGLLLVWLNYDSTYSDLSPALITSLVTIAAMNMLDYGLWGESGKLSWFVLGLAFAYGKNFLNQSGSSLRTA